MTQGWSTIESDPAVFTSLSRDFGIRGTQVEEIVTMEDAEFSNLAPIYGLIFLFKWTQDMASTHRASSTCVQNHNLYFAKQVIHNACGTQALLNIMMNAEGINLGKELTEFKTFTADFPPDLKGEAMSNSEMMRSCHNSFARPEPFEMEEDKSKKDGDAYHFTAYMPVDGKLWELDGLQEGPILLGDCRDSTQWWKQVRSILQERIEKYSSNEIRFNLLAVCANKKDMYMQELCKLQSDSQLISAALLSHGEEVEDMMMEDIDTEGYDSKEAPVDVTDKNVEQLKSMLNGFKYRASELRQLVDMEDEKFQRYARENARRRHNFIPFIMNLLQGLADKQKLAPLIESAERKAEARKAAKASKS